MASDNSDIQYEIALNLLKYSQSLENGDYYKSKAFVYARTFLEYAANQYHKRAKDMLKDTKGFDDADHMNLDFVLSQIKQ